MEVLSEVMRWVVAPLVGVVWVIFGRQQTQATELAVLKSQVELYRTTHEREIEDIKSKLDLILNKLDSKADK